MTKDRAESPTNDNMSGSHDEEDKENIPRTDESKIPASLRDYHVNTLKCHQVLLYNRLRVQKDLLKNYLQSTKSLDLVNLETTNMERIFSELCDTSIKYQTLVRSREKKISLDWLASVDGEVFEMKQKVCSWLRQMESKLYHDVPLTTTQSGCGHLNDVLPYVDCTNSKQLFHKEIPLAIIKPVSRDSKLSREPSLRRQMFTQKIEQQLQEYQIKTTTVREKVEQQFQEVKETPVTQVELTDGRMKNNKCKTVSEGVNRLGKGNVDTMKLKSGSNDSISDIRYISHAMINMVKENSFTGYGDALISNDEFV